MWPKGMDRNHDRLFDIFPLFFFFYYIWWRKTGRDVCYAECIEVSGQLLRVSSLPPHVGCGDLAQVLGHQDQRGQLRLCQLSCLLGLAIV